MTIRAITTPEKAKHRGEGQYSEVFVIPRVPNVIYTARLNGVPSSTDMVAQIAFDTGSGTLANIRLDMSVKVGTTAGADDLGYCRIRKAPLNGGGGTGTFYIGELSHIDWQADCYLTVIDDYDYMPRHIRIVSGVPYIDYDIAYSNQHSVFDPIVNMGGHRVLILPSGGTVSHERTSAESLVFGGTVSSRLWEAPGAASITGATSTAATFQYNTAGHFVEYCTITSNGSKSFTGARYVFVVAEADLPNIHTFRLRDDTGGVTMDFTMSQDANLTDFPHRAFVIAFSNDYYQKAPESIGYVEYEENILGSGRIQGETIKYNAENGMISFRASNARYWMSRITAFPFGIEQTNTTTLAWTSMNGVTVDRVIWHLLHYRSTITRTTDFHPSNDDRYAKELSSINSNLLSQVDEIAMTSIVADLVFDRFNACWLRVEPQLVPEADRSGWVVVQDLTEDDWQNDLTVDLTTYEKTSNVNSSGVSVELHGEGKPHFSLSYGRIPAIFGNPTVKDRLLLESQDQSNSLAGLFMGWENCKFDPFTVEFVGNNRFVTLGEYSRFSFDAGNNPRGYEYTGYLIPRSYDMAWTASTGVITVTVQFQDESVEQISVTGDFPIETGIDEIDFSTPPIPQIPIPSFPPVILPPSVVNLTHPKNVILSSHSATSPGVFYTKTFDATNPEWFSMNTGIDASDKQYVYKTVVTPSGAIYIYTSNGTVAGLYRASGLGGSWASLWRTAGEPVLAIGVNPYVSDQVAFVTYNTGSGVSTFRLASGGGISAGSTFNTRLQNGDIIFMGNKWHYFGSSLGVFATPYGYVFSSGGSAGYSASINSAVGQDAASRFAIPKGETIFQWDSAGSFGYNTIVPGTLTVTRTAPPALAWQPQAAAFSPTGQVGIYVNWASVVPLKTTDGGATWNTLGLTVPAGTDVWENCMDDNRFIFAGGVSVRLTLDVGSSFVEKAGNLTLIAPLIDVNTIRYIP